jgi:ubiquinol-cytochrome c reductase cytochrome b subunit
MVGRILDWIDDRSGYRRLLGHALDEPVPGGARLRYVFGSVLVFLFMQQVVLGTLLATYYSPSASSAWASTAYIQDQVTAGWFLRGLHHHGSSAMVVVTLLHFLQVVIAGAYRAPRELNWWTGLLMAGLVGAFALTGYLLPWDQKGYWATQVATGILGGVPLGEVPQQLAQGGDEYGNLTITRFYALHVFVLPTLLVGLLVGHIYLFRHHGVTPPANLSDAELEKRTQPFWPNQLFLDICAMAVTGGVLVWLTYQTHGAELFGPADPASNFVARPEWYFLFLFQLLKYFEGPLAIIATVIIPGAVGVFLFALPFLDRSKSRRPAKRMPVLSAVGLVMAGVVALSALAVVADRQSEEFAEGLSLAHEDAERARALALEGVPPAGGLAVWQNDPEYQALELFKEHCEGCHDIDGRGSDDAPSLRHYNDRAWLRGVVREPRSRNYFGGTEAHEDMETFSEEDLSDADLDGLVEYMVELRGDGVAFDPALAKKGAAMWDDSDCSGCHEIEAGAPGAGSPTLAGRGSYEWIVRVITDSGQKDLFDEGGEMPKFGEKISEEEIRTLARLVLDQGGFEGIDPPEDGAPKPEAPAKEPAQESVKEPAEASTDAPLEASGG